MGRPIICATMAEAVADIPDNVMLLIPGFGPGSPINLMTALFHQGAKGLTTVSNGAGGGGVAASDGRKGLGDFIDAGRVKKVIAAFTAPTHPSRVQGGVDLVKSGALEAELVPQGTIAERVRAGGAGIPAVYLPASVGTVLAEGKEHRDFDGETYVLEHAIFADYAFIRAWKADTAGNLIYRMAGRNFNPIFAMGAKHTFVEVEEPIVPAGELPPDQIHTPGIYVERLIQIPPDGYMRMERMQPAAAPAPAPRR
jgi:3-oxoacid CoA-transferase A subunit